MQMPERHKARVIKRAVKVDSIPVLAAAVEAKASCRRTAQARLIEAGESEARIEVVCACGEKMVIACEYGRRKQVPG